MTHLTNIEVSATDIAPTVMTPPLYLRIAGKSPNEVPVTGGVKERPLEVSWFIGPEYKRTGGYYLYRYKLYPVDDGWSAWTRETAVNYTFLQKGYHELSVQARHVLGATNLDSREARISFSLSAPLLSPTLKGPSSKGAELQAVDFKVLYPKSRALLVGVWQFDDKSSFPSFDGKKIQNDIDVMGSALAANGFLDIERLVQPRLTKNEIDDAIAKFINRATKGDRLVIYFSTHGFSESGHSEVGYLATSDCEQALPTSRCVSLSSLREHASRALTDKTNPAKQVLIAVDSCFAGLGVMAKASIAQAPNLSRLAAESGAYMITAGMADQKAEISPVYGGSTFTHFLANGLKGDADIMKGGVITLSELLIFVQYEVARATESRQIPMMGRIAGGGEMLFAPAAASLTSLSGN